MTAPESPGTPVALDEWVMERLAADSDLSESVRTLVLDALATMMVH